MDNNPHACGCRSGTSSATCECIWTKETRATGSHEYFRGCYRPLHTGSEAMKDITETTATLKHSDGSMRKRNVARVLFPQRMVQPTEGYQVSHAHVHTNYVHEHSIIIDQPKTNSITTWSTCDGSVSNKRRQLISDAEVVRVISIINTDNTASNGHASANHLSTPDKTMAYPTSWASDKGWETDYDSADETVYLPDITPDDHELEGCWTGYEDELFQIERDRKKGASNADGFLFDNGPDNQMVMRLGQRFEDDFQFRRAIKVLAIWDVKEHTNNVFVISHLTPEHTCKKRWLKLQWGTKWIAAKFLHIWKLNAVDSTATKWLRTDHADGYAQLIQYKHEMEDINDRNIVIIETITDHPLRPKNVMLVAVCRDGNDAVLPIAFCEVQEENLDSWAFFLTNLTYGLRFERGEGLCILADGDNGVDEVVEEFLPYAVYRQCCFTLYGRMVRNFPDVRLHSAFWGACRSTERKSFIDQMSIIETVNIKCHNWLKDTDSKTWPLFSMPQWVKSTEVTKSASEQLRIWLIKFLDLNVAQRYTTITRTIAEMFQRRYLAGWEWSWGDKLEKYVHRLWSVDEYRSAYGPGMQMLLEITHWEWQTKDNVLPPMKNSTNSSGSNEANCHSKAFKCGLTRRRLIRASGLPLSTPAHTLKMVIDLPSDMAER
ncbi:hypothetical protein WN944_003465 [Citrus x changshan-huyou]|uniref:MULE transposase domain-containing protein n=1 Tax=Citrus x changshan-huyou TaxID=2935761 RepID=A0AAP0M1G2_9ROSI